MHFNGSIASLACVHKIMEQADDVSKLRDFAGYAVTGLIEYLQRPLASKNKVRELTICQS